MQKVLVINWFNLKTDEEKEQVIRVDKTLNITENLLIDLISNFCGVEEDIIKIEGYHFEI